MIRVTIKLAGPLRNCYKTSPSVKGEEVRIDQGATVADLLDAYNIIPKKAHLIVINRKKADLATDVRDGDEITILPLAGGG